MIHATNIVYGTDLKLVPTLFLEFRAGSDGPILKDASEFENLCKAHHGYDWNFTQDAKKFDEIWSARRGCYLASMKYRGPSPDLVFISDVCVPLTKLAACISDMEKFFVEAGFPCLLCAHISDGNFHALIPYKAHEKSRVMELEKKVILQVVSMGGAVSGEHGVGIGKMCLIEAEHGAEHMELQRRIKAALDPNNIMNPQKIFTLPKASL
jgi:D-lactate dehydrogenase (cytochrome)